MFTMKWHYRFVGLGMRGPGAVERFTYIPGVQIVALCDYEQERAEKCQKFLQKASMPKAAVYSGEKGYEQLCKRDDIDLVYVATDWLHHFPVATVCFGKRKECGNRSSVSHESEGMLGFGEHERKDPQTLHVIRKLLLRLV